MNEQTKSLIRNILQFLGGTVFGAALLAKIGFSVSDIPGIVEALGGLASAIAVIWGLWRTRQQGLVKAAAAIVPVPAASQAKVGIEVPVAPKTTNP